MIGSVKAISGLFLFLLSAQVFMAPRFVGGLEKNDIMRLGNIDLHGNLSKKIDLWSFRALDWNV